MNVNSVSHYKNAIFNHFSREKSSTVIILNLKWLIIYAKISTWAKEDLIYNFSEADINVGSII